MTPPLLLGARHAVPLARGEVLEVAGEQDADGHVSIALRIVTAGHVTQVVRLRPHHVGDVIRAITRAAQAAGVRRP